MATIPVKVSICAGLDAGMDCASPVDFTYSPPFACTGTIEKVTVELKTAADNQAAASA